MAEEAAAEELENSPLEMSDDELLNMAPPEDEPLLGGDDTPTPEPEPKEEPDGLQEEEQASTEEEVDAAPQSVEDPAPPTDTPDGDGQPAASADPVAAPAAKGTPPKEIDYKAEYERLIAPFKANGRQMQVTGVDDALTLMQMGANYNKKMAGLKPNLKLMKMLEHNELLDESKLSFLIDLQKKDPAAIAQFLKDSEIDPLDIDLEQDTKYKPKAYTVDDKELELDEVLDSIQDTSTFKETIDIISNKWDATSKKVALDNPALIKIINEQVESGIYSQITEIVENEKAMGRLNGMDDLTAYKHVGDVIQANGGFNQPAPNANNSQAPAPVTPGNAAPAPADPKLNDRRRAAGSTRNAPAAAPITDYNPLSLSDDDFENLAGGKYI